MHILLALIGALAGLFWAFTRFVGAAREGREAVNEVRGLFRRGKWSRKIDKRHIENLEDPRESAAIVLFQLAAYEGAIIQAQLDHMMQVMMTSFETSKTESEEFIAFARMAMGEINDASNSLTKILRPVNDMCSEKEKQELLAMMESVAGFGGNANDQQTHLISQARNIFFH